MAEEILNKVFFDDTTFLRNSLEGAIRRDMKTKIKILVHLKRYPSPRTNSLFYYEDCVCKLHSKAYNEGG